VELYYNFLPFNLLAVFTFFMPAATKQTQLYLVLN